MLAMGLVVSVLQLVRMMQVVFCVRVLSGVANVGGVGDVLVAFQLCVSSF